jgi:hypothetical protein
MKRSRNNKPSQPLGANPLGTQPRLMLALTTRGLRAIPVNDEAAEIIAHHWLAIMLYMNTGGAGLLESLEEWKQLTDGKHTITLETDPQAIDRRGWGLRLFVAHKQGPALAGQFGFETAGG